MNIQEFEIKDLSLHKYIDRNPLPTQEQYEAMFDSISKVGQLVPIWINKTTKNGKIIHEVFDGRHRIKALKELNRNKVTGLVFENLPDDEIIRKIEGSEMRRHDSASQLAIKAWYDYIDPNSEVKTLAEAARKHGASLANIKRANKIGNVNQPGSKRRYYARRDILDLIYNGGAFPISDRITTTSLATIENWLAKNSLVPQDVGMEFKIRKNLTEDEEELVDKYYQAIISESDLMIQALTERLYAYLKGE